jgi:hypothetical protein
MPPRHRGPPSSSRVALGLLALLFGLGANGAPQIDAEPSRVVLGTDTVVRIAVRSTGGALHGAASAGTLIAEDSSEGTAHFRWLPPDTKAPFVAVLAFWESGPLGLRSVTTLTLPCAGRTDLAIDTEPGARVTVEIGGAHFGPRRADARGKLRMPVEVTPYSHEARITAEVGEQSKVRVVPLPATPNPWVWVVEPSPFTTETDGRALLLAPGPMEQPLVVRVAGGVLEREATEPDRVLYRLAPLSGSARITLEAGVAAESTVRAVSTVEVVPAPSEAAGPTPPPQPAAGRRLEIGAALGAFFAGGHNAGPAFAATLSVAPWRFPLYLELELGLRAAWFSTPTPGLGTASASLVAFPLEFAVRGPLWTAGHWRLDLRAGGGVLLGTNWVGSDFGQSSSQALTGWEVFGAAQVLYQVGAFLPYAEVRGAYAAATGMGVTANPGGLVLLLGFHWVWSVFP